MACRASRVSETAPPCYSKTESDLKREEDERLSRVKELRRSGQNIADIVNTEFTQAQRLRGLVSGNNLKPSVRTNEVRSVRRKAEESKTTKYKKPRNPGKLERLLKMPPEVICLVAEMLHPVDLLHLSRASRDLRHFFMCLRMRNVWQRCMDTIKIPRCPGNIGMNEPQVVSLLFEYDCHGCGTPDSLDSLLLRICLCQACASLNVGKGLLILHKYRQDGVPDISHLIPSLQGRFLLPDLRHVVETYMLFHTETAASDRFTDELKRSMGSITRYSEDLRKWQFEYYDMKEEEEKRISAARQESIHNRLVEIGYSEEEILHCRSRDFETQRRLREILLRPHKLTDGIWKRIMPELVDLLQPSRAALRLERKRNGLLDFFRSFHTKCKQGSSEPIVFNFTDFMQLPFVSSILEDVDVDRFMPVHADRLNELLPGMVKQHNRIIRCDCLNAVLKTYCEVHLEPMDVHRGQDAMASDDAVLDYASTSFVFEQGGSRGSPISVHDDFKGMMNAFRAFPFPDNAASLHQPCAWKEPKIDADFLRAAERVLESLNMPLDTTIACMDSLAPSISCQNCVPRGRNFECWREIVLHYKLDHIPFQDELSFELQR